MSVRDSRTDRIDITCSAIGKATRGKNLFKKQAKHIDDMNLI